MADTQVVHEIIIDTSKGEKEAIKSSKKIDKSFKKLGKAALGVGVALGTAVVAGVVKVSKNLDKLDKRSKGLAVSTDFIQQWDFIASQSGVTSEGLDALIKKQGQVIAVGGEAAKTYEKLGIAIEGATDEEIFEASIAALQGVTDETERTRLAQELFGRQASEALKLVASDVDQLKATYEELGLEMSEEQIANGAALQDNLDQLQRAFGAVFATLVADLLPAFITMGNWILTTGIPALKQFFTWFSEHIMPILKTVAKIIFTVVIPTLANMITWVIKAGQGILGFFKTMGTGIGSFVDSVINMGKSVVNFFAGIGDAIKNSFKSAINFVIALLNGFTINGWNFAIKVANKVPGINIPLIPKIPSLAIGTNMVNSDGMAEIHRGEAIVPASVVSGGFTGGLGNSNVTLSQQPIQLNIDSEELVQIIMPEISRQVKLAGGNL